jgi:hypothetical protein
MIEPTLQEAEMQMVRLMAKERQIYDDHIAKDGGCNNEVWSEISEPIKEEYEAVQTQLRDLGGTLMGYPKFSPMMICWMVDVKGMWEVEVEGLMDKLRENADDAPNFASSMGRLQKDIVAVATKRGFTVTDSGGCHNQWHIGFPCNNGQADYITSLIYNHFRVFFDEGVIWMKRWPIGPHLPGLTCDSDLQKWLDDHSTFEL